MPFRRHPRRVAREAKNAQALRAMGLDASLAAGFLGDLVFQGDPNYNADRQVANPAFQADPFVIAYCIAPSDVAWCLSTVQAQPHPMAFVCRSGGHNTAGYSTIQGGMIIDTSRLNGVAMFPTLLPPPPSFPMPPFQMPPYAGVVMVGPGTQFANLNSYLSSYMLHVPGGGCGDVCVGGYMQGGGYGFTSRAFGMNSDNVVGFTMMLFDGSVVTADRNTNADLFWAVRGGTGNNFGVLLQVAYGVQFVPSVWGVWLQWPIANAATALLAMQENYMLSGAPSTFGYMTVITVQNGTPVLTMRAMFIGSEADLNAQIQPLLDTPGAGSPPNFPLVQQGTYAAMNTALLETPYDIPQLPPNITWGEDKQAGYIETTLGLSDWQAIIDYYLSGPPPYSTLVIEPYGGAINQVPVGDSAFIHRTVAMDFFVDVFWDMSGNGEAQAKQWLDGFMQLMQPYFNGHVYQNYPRGSLPNFQQAYWGRAAYATLVEVKNKYDPGNVFNFPQSIGTSLQELNLKRMPTAADAFLKMPIVYMRDLVAQDAKKGSLG
jgi:FAD/FMN-containing dehydrogenase